MCKRAPFSIIKSCDLGTTRSAGQRLKIYSLVDLKYFMQHVRNGLIIHLTNSLKIIFVKTNLTPKSMINLKKSRTSIEIGTLDNHNLFIRHNHVHG